MMKAMQNIGISIIQPGTCLDNMTFQVDTFLAAANFGLRWENGIHVTENGCDMLSKYKTEIIEIE